MSGSKAVSWKEVRAAKVRNQQRQERSQYRGHFAHAFIGAGRLGLKPVPVNGLPLPTNRAKQGLTGLRSVNRPPEGRLDGKVQVVPLPSESPTPHPMHLPCPTVELEPRPLLGSLKL